MTRSADVAWSSVGIDVSKAELVIAVAPSGERWTSATPPEALVAFVARVKTLAPSVVVLEATAGDDVPVAVACAAAGLPVAVVNPRQIRAFAQAIGRTAKTDPIDAEVIALFGERVRPEPRPLPDARHPGVGRAGSPASAAAGDASRRAPTPEQATATAVRRDLRQHVTWLNRRVADTDNELQKRISEESRLAGEGRSAAPCAGHRSRGQPDAAGRVTGTRPAGSADDRRARRRRAHESRERPVPRQTNDLGRACLGAPGPLHGGAGREPVQRPPSDRLPAAAGGRQTQEARVSGGDAQALTILNAMVKHNTEWQQQAA